MVDGAGHKAILGQHHGAIAHPRHEIIVPLQPIAVALIGGVVNLRRHGGLVDIPRGVGGKQGGMERTEAVGAGGIVGVVMNGDAQVGLDRLEQLTPLVRIEVLVSTAVEHHGSAHTLQLVLEQQSQIVVALRLGVILV